MNKDEICGTDIGIFKILYICDQKTSDGHKLYHVKCNVCNYEADMLKSKIKITKKCCHIGKDGNYINRHQDNSVSSKTKKRLRTIYNSMLDRCYNQNHKDYKYYGAKGIHVCKQWLNNRDEFYKWAFENGYQDTLTIDRIDSNKGYTPENCQWITLEENARKAGNVNWITVNNMTKTGRQWADFFNIGTNTINGFLKKYTKESVQALIKKMLDDPYIENKKIIISENNGKISWFNIYNINPIKTQDVV